MIDKRKFLASTQSKADDFLDVSRECIVQTKDEFSAAFLDFNILMIEGTTFRPTKDFNRKRISLVRSMISLINPNKIGLSEVLDLVNKSIAEFHSKNSSESFNEILYSNFIDYTENFADYLGPCQMFSFEDGCNTISSSLVDIVSADEAARRLQKVAQLSEVEIQDQATFEVNLKDGKFFYSIGGPQWHIRCAAPKELTREEAKWLADVFISYFRLTHRADYCHRAKLGQVEPKFDEDPRRSDKFTKLHKDHASGLNLSRAPIYKIDKSVIEKFHTDENQSVLSAIIRGKEHSLAERLKDALGWLSRARQATDVSERLLFNFTALEAILSQQDQFYPVSETISRMASVILSDSIETRISVYSEIKELYTLRSHLVHRGRRKGHKLSANNLEHIAESCIKIIIHKCDLAMPHGEFMNDLKHHSHGTAWIIKE